MCSDYIHNSHFFKMMALKGIRVSFYTEDEIRKLCVVKVTNAATYDRGVPRIEGLNDPRLGVSHQTTRCPTCNEINCDQHMGYIELARPVYRLGAINYIIQILRCVCRQCARPKFGEELLQYSSWSPKDRLRLMSDLCKTRYVCPHCKAPQPTYTRKDRTFIETSYRPKELALITDLDMLSFVTSPFTPEEARAILEAIPDDTKTILSLFHPEEMVTRLQIIPPPCVRPSNFVGETKVRSENDLTVALQDLVRASLDTAIDPKQWIKLQVMQAGLVNHTIKKTIGGKLGVVPNLVVTNKRKIADLKTRLSGKKGRFRGNLSGKRVDQSGRSVVGPDSSHDITELGVPSTMMNTFSYPERVTSLNKTVLAYAIITGAYEDNGAMAVKQGDSLIWLPILDLDARKDLAAQIKPGDIVERHLREGDWVIFNRQPSLWKASMMAFTIYRTNTLCFRLPLPVTKPFNADFDGDEMNVHSLQGYEALAEAQELLSVPQQMMNAQSNSIIVGLVQDSLVGGYKLTSMDTFLTPSVFNRLAVHRVYDPSAPGYSDMGSPHWSWPTMPPAILKSPRGPLYTGKQLVSYLLPDISLRKCVRSEQLFNDDEVLISHGTLLSGQLCKATLGASNQGIIQSIFRTFGSWAACKFVSDAQRLFVQYLAQAGPSISILDCCVVRPLEIIRTSLEKAAAILSLDLPPEVIEAKSSSVLQETLRTVGGTVAQDLRKTTGLSSVVTSGSKGNLMNIAQIAGCVGQQTVFGRRIPMRNTPIGKRTLAYFAPDDKSPSARGFIENSYMTGLRPQEFFYHQMAGREGIVATAVNTADSGYNQRRMIKSQESQCIAYDGTVRVCGKFIVQGSYGYDDLDGSAIVRSRLSVDLLTRAADSSDATVRACADFLATYMSKKALFLKELDLTVVCPLSTDAFGAGSPPDYTGHLSDFLACHAALHRKQTWHMTLPAATAILLMFQAAESNKYGDRASLVKMYASGLIQPGESVGALAATSIGEPSMQMTLNVFHYTGIASKNVTITGLPRFRQLINAVDTYETANMNAEVLSYDSAPRNVHSVTLGMVADAIVEPMHPSSFQDRLLRSILVTPGPLLQKVVKRKVELVSSPFRIRVTLRWDDCERLKVTQSDVATGLRKSLQTEAAVIAGPNYENAVFILPASHTGTKQWAEAIAESLQHILVSGIPGIKRSLLLQEPRYEKLVKRSTFCIDTEGSSLLEFCKTEGLNVSTATTNNVLEVASVLGITAAINVLHAELHKVLSFDSAYVDPRHTLLLADTMCRTGSVCAMNRHNMESLGNSILQRASFEQSLEIFHEGAVFGRTDTMSGATERIMVGQPANVGTGMVHIVSTGPAVAPTVSFVPKLRDAASDSFVRPMRVETSFSLESFALRVQETSRESAQASFLDVFARWRTFAGIHRYAAQVRATKSLEKESFQRILSEVRNSGNWTKTSTESHTRVQYTFQDKPIETIIKGNFAREHSTTEIVERVPPFLVFVQKSTSVPTSVIPETVSIENVFQFFRNGFILELREMWSAETHTDAEAKYVTEAPTLEMSVSFETPDSMLQVRATNAQFVNAFLSRL